MFKANKFLEAFKSALTEKNYLYIEPMNKSGGWADLFYIYSRDDKEIRVAKIYREPLGRITENIYKSDAKKLIEINHDNVVKIFDKGIIEYEDNKYFFLILEHIRGKNFNEIDSRLFLELPYVERLIYFVQTLDGINEFRKNFKLHHDLHSGNIMLSEENKNKLKTIKIIDPGSSRYSYEPEDEDIDLYLIKEEFIDLFLRQEEKQKINENINLKELNFPEFRDLIKNLIKEEENKINLENMDSNIEKENVNLLIEQLDEERENIYEEINSIDPKRKHITFSFATVPIKLDPSKLEFNDENTIRVLKNSHKELIFRNPYGGMCEFDEFLRDFRFQGDWYQANYLVNSDMLFNFCRAKIHKKGIISISVAMDAEPVESLRGSITFLRKDVRLLSSLWISTDLLAYLIIMWLKLIKTIYLDLHFQGILKLNLEIYSGWDLSLAGEMDVLLGNNISPKSEIDVEINDLKDNNKLLIILKSIIKELLRYFNIDIDKFEDGYSLFEKTINTYFNNVFKHNK